MSDFGVGEDEEEGLKEKKSESSFILIEWGSIESPYDS